MISRHTVTIQRPTRMPSHIYCSDETVSQVRLYAQQLLRLADQYKELTDSYVVEFFVKRRWDLIPKSWQGALGSLQHEDLARYLLDEKAERFPSVWPLSLLAYRAATRVLALDPTPAQGGELSVPQDPAFKPIDLLCRLHVKAKKRHEILRMAEVINSSSMLTGSEKVVDVGSGQGHLSRLLSFGYGLNVTSIEAVGCHLTGAAKVDTKIRTIIQKRIAMQSEESNGRIPHTPPQHVECMVHPHITVEEFVNVINSYSQHAHDPLSHSTHGECGEAADFTEGRKDYSMHPAIGEGQVASESGNKHQDFTAGGEARTEHKRRDCDSSKATGSPNISCRESKVDSSFVLAGLHTCGDLAPTMLRVFSKCPQAKALVSVACCYMKMDCAIPTPPNLSSPAASIHTDGPFSDCSARTKSHPSFESSQVVEDVDQNEQGISSNADDRNHARDSDRACPTRGYPMSEWVKSLGGKGLQFEALELACHSLHGYKQKLKARDPRLILHAYRCAVEVLIQEADPMMTQTHAGVCRIKKAVAAIRKPHLKSFEEYAAMALAGLDIPVEERHLAELGEKYLSQSNNVIAFHVLRSMMGPIIESLLLVDRVLFLGEQGIDSRLVPVFDASLSPRNFALVASKH